MKKFPTCIAWLDELTEGGLPAAGMTLLCGGPGAGKTILACQIAASLANSPDSPAYTLFVGFEERAGEIASQMENFDWHIDAAAASGAFSFMEAKPSADTVFSGDFDLQGLLSAIAAKARQSSARVVILDGLDEVLRWLPNDNRRATEIGRIKAWLDRDGLVAIVTAKAAPGNGDLLEAFGPLQFAVSLVIALERTLTFGGTLRTLRVLKYRGSGHGTAAYPYYYSRKGLEPIEWRATPTLQAGCGMPTASALSTGIPRLDVLLGGAGYPRGGSVLISGAPGTGKSSLGAVFADATCRGDGRALYVAFDSPPEALARDMTSLGIDLASHVASGSLRMLGFHAAVLGPEQVLGQILAAVEAFRPDAVVIDPASALVSEVDSNPVGPAVVRRLVNEARALGIGLVLTSLVAGSGLAAAMEPDTSSGVSTIADFWIVLGYAENGGERNRTLSVVKARGRSHSSQTRELIMSDAGCTLMDVYTAGGEVLLGTARLEREAADRAANSAALEEQRRSRLELQRAVAEADARLALATEDLRGARERLLAEEEAGARKAADAAEKRRQVAISRSADVVQLAHDGTQISPDDHWFGHD